MAAFKDIIGQQGAIDRLQATWRSGRLPHGLIFAGTAGVGKGLTAEVLAKLFLCHQPADADPCEHCDSCRLFAAGTHPDFHRVYRQLIRQYKDSKARDLAIDVIREELLRPAAMKAALGHGKVFVVEEAELMNRDAANALLKTLEEPQGRSLIILLTDQPLSLISTIRSRCQTITFAPLPPGVVQAQLELRGIDTQTAVEAAGLSEGSLGNALRWAQSGIVERTRELRERLGGFVQGKVAFSDFRKWFELAAADYAKGELQRDPDGSEDQAKRRGASLYLLLAANILRNRLRLLPDTPRRLATCDAIDELVRAELYLDSNVSMQVSLDGLLAGLEKMGKA